jgi:hypothetical protein
MSGITDIQTLEFIGIGHSLNFDNATNTMVIEDNIVGLHTLKVSVPRPESIVQVITSGPQGPPGPPGSVTTFSGMGPPGTIIGSSPGDTYLDITTGIIYVLQ